VYYFSLDLYIYFDFSWLDLSKDYLLRIVRLPLQTTHEQGEFVQQKMAALGEASLVAEADFARSSR
jgi:hypothetical protein